jgi:hypothetical protein
MSYGADLYWLPLGAGGHSVRLNGRAYEAVVAASQRRTGAGVATFTTRRSSCTCPAAGS